MIPKIVHYVWFGNAPYPPKVLHCMESWKRVLPDYEFMLWNEKTFDVRSSKFTMQAYENKKWAFISDYVRNYALSKYGGWYLDTDVEVVKSFNDLLNHRCILSTDESGFIESAVMASEKGHKFFTEMLQLYNSMTFVREDGSLNTEVANTYLQNLLTNYGYTYENKYKSLDKGIIIFPDDYFHAFSLASGEIHKTENTYSIHWHTLLWVSKKTRLIKFIRMRLLIPIIGTKKYIKMKSIIRLIWKK